MSGKFKQSKSTVTATLNRSHSYSTQQDGSRSLSGNASSTLADVVSRSASPGWKSPQVSPLPSPSEHSHPGRRTSWEDCMLKRAGYTSFPDFDQLRAQLESKKT
ncbi:uncharacterized protein RCC_07474 [Ramularia collo-cygni]|uniref:Uncharacterized protein n=1 Tax=Ramularia collo-cygni TaxID=112498 RepID=A0A2D3V844_9PEZI|nr:uncharacterized protein RCC_07474 [Ramularia collo-cygni]CZT21610.1 uncharacterized protein RCC_07474 [Ramularia collo-cygni]